jgi:hypothetical protein
VLLAFAVYLLLESAGVRGGGVWASAPTFAVAKVTESSESPTIDCFTAGAPALFEYIILTLSKGNRSTVREIERFPFQTPFRLNEV